MSEGFDLERTASTLYGTPAAKPAAKPADDGAIMAPADVLFGSPDATPAKSDDAPVTDEDRAAALFSSSPIHGDAERAIERAALEDGSATPDAAREAAQSWRGTFDRHGLNSTESAQLADLAIAAHRQPADEQTRARWAEDAKAALLQDFGPENIALALADAKKIIAKDPKLAAYLDQSGLGSHPTVVRLVAQKARAMRKAGRL